MYRIVCESLIIKRLLLRRTYLSCQRFFRSKDSHHVKQLSTTSTLKIFIKVLRNKWRSCSILLNVKNRQWKFPRLARRHSRLFALTSLI
jgi:hypothetical protein